jgi:glycosyltransferase involved in cell wall biosynthesis
MAEPGVTKTFFSIVIPTYNRAEFIEKAIRSVLSQTITDLEVIVVDDGSTDNTAEVVAAIDDPRISYHQKKNEERAVARNTGVSLARGDYVSFLDSDDILYKDHLSTALEMIEKYDRPEIFHLGYEFVDEVSGARKGVNALPETVNDELINGNCLSCNGVFLRRDIAEKHMFNPDRDLSGTEDYELWLRLASRYPIHCNNRITSAIIQHDQRSVVTTDQAKLVRRIKLLEKYLLEDETFVEKYKDRLPEFRANNRLYIALHLALAGQRSDAVSYLAKSVGSSPKAFGRRSFYGTIKRLFIKV